MAKMCTTRVKVTDFHEDLFKRLFLYFVDCMMPWTVTDCMVHWTVTDCMMHWTVTDYMMQWTITYTLKLSDAVEFHTVFLREKSVSYGLQNTVRSPHNTEQPFKMYTL
jgi:uncharacterized membrane protein (UPF0182 family)